MRDESSMSADLHIHSIFSADGEIDIPGIIKKCYEAGVNTFSITDHNTVTGSREALTLTAGNSDIQFIPGIEIDCNYKGNNLHLLGYGIQLDSGDFDALETDLKQRQFDALPGMIANMEKLGIPVDREALISKAEGKVPTGELFAEVLLKDPGLQTNPVLKPYLPGGERSEMPLINFYLDFFAQGKPAYVQIDYPDFRDAVDLVRNNGGIPLVAHPGLNLEGCEELVEELMDQGAAGLEVFNNYHSPDQVKYFAGITQKRAALMSCGSDFHGFTKPRISIGQYRSPGKYREYLEQSLSRILENNE